MARAPDVRMERRLALFVALGLVGCAAPASEETSEGGDAFTLRRQPTTAFVRGRAVFSDGAVANVLAQSEHRTTIATYRDGGELSGLVHQAGAKRANLAYGIVCAPPTRDHTCVVRWIAKDRQTASVVLAGEIGAAMAKVFSSPWQGDPMSIQCDGATCTVTGLDAASATFDEVSLDASTAESFAGIK